MLKGGLGGDEGAEFLDSFVSEFITTLVPRSSCCVIHVLCIFGVLGEPNV